MADTINDCARDAAKELYGLSVEGMIAWLKFTGKSGLPDWFLDNILIANDTHKIAMLCDQFWDEYAEEINLGNRV